jgi:hypothetical protein
MGHVLPSPSSSAVDVFVVDAPAAAAVALHTPRTADAESTHVLCRHLAEQTAEFVRRVQRRIERLARTHRLRSLWYVMGKDAACSRSAVPLFSNLLSLLEADGCRWSTGASLTVVGPSSHRSSVFEWVDVLLHQRVTNVDVRARLYTEGREESVLASSLRAARREHEHEHAPRAVARAGGWLPLDRRSVSRGRPTPEGQTPEETR